VFNRFGRRRRATLSRFILHWRRPTICAFMEMRAVGRRPVQPLFPGTALSGSARGQRDGAWAFSSTPP